MGKDTKIEICDCDPEPHVKHLLGLFDEPAGYLEVRCDDVLTAIVVAPLRPEAFGPLWDAAHGRKQKTPWWIMVGAGIAGALFARGTVFLVAYWLAVSHG